MNRRGFLTAIAAAVAGSTIDPERLLWVPGRKLISIPREARVLRAVLQSSTTRFDADGFHFTHTYVLTREMDRYEHIFAFRWGRAVKPIAALKYRRSAEPAACID